MSTLSCITEHSERLRLRVNDGLLVFEYWDRIGILHAYNLIASREAIFQAWQITPSASLQERVLPSTLAGGFTGGAVGALISMLPSLSLSTLWGRLHVRATYFWIALLTHILSNQEAAPTSSLA